MKYINTLIATVKDLDLKVSRIMKNGFKFSFILCLFATYLLVTYHFTNTLSLFYIGISLFKTSLSFAVAFFICGISFNTIIKQIG